MKSTYELAIIGAGAAGIGAAKAAQRLGLDFIVMEASHRTGGRGYTEHPTDDIAFDLGCHWLHCASRNPLTQLLKLYSMEVTKTVSQLGFYRDQQWLGQAGDESYNAFETAAYKNMLKLADSGEDFAAVETYDRDGEWTSFFDYWVSLLFSSDPDQISFRDFTDFGHTGPGEDWPVKQGLGTLLSRFAEDIPVNLNTAVEQIDSSSPDIEIKTSRGDVRANSIIITVSTGVLNAKDIRFKPSLPDWKQQAINNLQLGNHNRICLVYDRNIFDDYQQETAVCLDGDEPPMYFEIRPFGLNYAVGSTGGRFADWLERAGQEASVDFTREKLMHMFGSDAGKHIQKTIVTAWRGDPWVRGAYSATTPGSYGARQQLAEPIDDRIYFAGEATSPEFMDTVHGAYISGVQAVCAVAKQKKMKIDTQPEDMAWSLANTN